jgi:hypothetical protein
VVRAYKVVPESTAISMHSSRQSGIFTLSGQRIRED